MIKGTDGFLIWVALFLSLLSVGGWARPDLAAQDRTALEMMERASARYQDIQGFCAEFQQVLEVPLLADTTRSRGTLCQSRPNLFAMRFSDPPGDALVADGDWFWVYYPSSDPRQVLQFDMDVQPGGVDFHREFLEDPAGKYEMAYVGEESLGGVAAHVIDVDPREASGFEGARLWLDTRRSLILQARIGMENGSVRTVTLSGITLNPPEDPDRFRFVPPEGARVIRRR